MKRLRTHIEIQATAERVWQVLTNFRAFPDWNPFIRSVDGELKEGASLKVYIKPPKGMGMTFRPTVLKVEPNAELRWTGSFLMPGVFDGEHYFLIEPLAEEGRVQFMQGESLAGVMVPVLGLLGVFKNTLRGFEEMNQALRFRAERGA